MNTLRKIAAIVRKDFISEIRTKEIFSTVLIFSIIVIVIFNFAFGSLGNSILSIVPGMLWVTFSFVGVLSLNRSFILEKEEDCLDGLKICPVGRDIIYLGKMFTSMIFILVIEFITLPIFSVLFNIAIISLELIVLIIFTTFGFAAVGTLFSALAVNSKAREMVLPLLLFPVVIPVIICAVKASESILAQGNWESMSPWIYIIAAFDVIFVVISILIFEYVIEE